MKQGAYVELYADIVAFLKLAPRTLSELVEMVGMGSKAVRRFLNALVAKGVARMVTPERVVKAFGTAPYRWEWVA